VPLLLGIFAIVTSTEALAGEEDSGQLELILAMPLKRWQIVSAKGLTAFIILVIAGAGNALVLSAVKATTPVDVTPLQLFGAILNGWPITMAFAMLGLFLSAYLPNRRAAAFTLTVIFVASFFGKALTSLVGSLEPVRRFLLFTYFNTTVSVFTEGIRPDDVALLLGLAALFFILALVSFERRNVTVGAWPWQRPQVESKSVGKQPR
jgi:ABC-2 type transport system permease protein